MANPDGGTLPDGAVDTGTDARPDAGTPPDGSLDATLPPLDGGGGPIDGRAPVLHNFRVQALEAGRLYFDSSEPIRATTTDGFVVSGRGLTGIVIREGERSGHYLEVESDFTFWDNTTIRYGGEGDIADLSGAEVHPFDLEYVHNLIEEPATPTELYVDASAAASGDGSSPARAFRTIMEAVAALSTPGTTIWVKAGDYGDERVQLFRMTPTPTADAPVKVIGYRERPGDIGEMYYAYGDGPLDPSEMPLLDGGDRGSGAGFVTTSGKGYVIVRNFQVTGYQNGFYNNGQRGVIFDNCIAVDVGTTSVFGRGFQLVGGARDSRVQRSLAVNSTLSAFSVKGDFNLLEANDARADEEGGLTMDYYFTVSTGTENTILLGNRSQRHRVGSDVWEHGLSLAGDGTGAERSRQNLVEDHLSIDMGKGLELRHDGATENVVRNFEYYGLGHGIMIRDGAHHNRIDGAYVHDAEVALSWTDSPETGSGSGYANTIVNSVFTNVRWFNYLSRPDGGAPEIADNLFAHNTYYNESPRGTLFEAHPAPTFRGNTFANCNIINVSNRGQVEGFSFISSNFHGGFVVDGEGLVSVDPGFASAVDDDFSLTTETPPAIREGGTQTVEARYDRDGVERVAPYSIGTYQWE